MRVGRRLQPQSIVSLPKHTPTLKLDGEGERLTKKKPTSTYRTT